MFTQTVAKEQREAEFPAKILAVAPGIIDTTMQDEIRASSPDDFGSVAQFIELKENGALSDPNAVAEKLAKLATSAEFKSGAILDISELA